MGSDPLSFYEQITMKKLGLIAGNRTFPIHVARAAKRLGFEVIAAGLREETDAALEREVDRMHWVDFSGISRVPELLKADGVKEVVLAGQIRPERLLKDEKSLDGVVKTLLRFAPDRSGSSAMKMAVRYLESQGFRVLESGTFLKDWIPSKGVLTQRQPDDTESADLAHGLKLARQLDRLGIGQAIALKARAVVAVEGIEGTDAMIRRAGEVAGPGCVVVKACGRHHDMRFDIPVVGEATLEAMAEAQVRCLGIEAGRTLLFERPQLIQQADQKGFVVAAL